MDGGLYVQSPSGPVAVQNRGLRRLERKIRFHLIKVQVPCLREILFSVNSIHSTLVNYSVNFSITPLNYERGDAAQGNKIVSTAHQKYEYLKM